MFLILLFVIILIAGCMNQSISQENKKDTATTTNTQEKQALQGRILFIIAQNNFRDEELFIPKAKLEGAGYKCEVASITTNPSRGMKGSTVTPDLAVQNANLNDYDLIVVVGGAGAPELVNHAEVLSFLSQARTNNKKLAAICLGPMVLAQAGALQGKKVTVFQTPDSVASLKKGGATLMSDSIVIDNDLVTANGPEVSEEFGNQLIALLKG